MLKGAHINVVFFFMQAKPTVRNQRYTQINHYDKLYKLFAKNRAIGADVASAKEKVSRQEKEGSSNQAVDVENETATVDSLDALSANVALKVHNLLEHQRGRPP